MLSTFSEKLLVYLGCFSGAWPVLNPFVSRSNYGFRYCSLSFLYWLFTFSYDWINSGDVAHVIGFSFYKSDRSNSDKQVLADSIMSSVLWFTQHSNCQILRLNFLLYCSLCLDLLKSIKICHCKLHQLHVQITTQNQNYMNKLRRPTHYFILFLSNALWFCCALISTLNYQQFYTEENMKNFWTLPNNLLANQILGAYVDLIPTFSTTFATSFFIVIGMELVDLLMDCAEVIDTRWKSITHVISCTASTGTSTVKQFCITVVLGESEYYTELQETALQLRTCYNAYHRIIGLPALILTFNATLNFVAVLYGWDSNGNGYVVTGTVASLLHIVLFSHFGYQMANQFAKMKEQLRVTLMRAAPSMHFGQSPERNYHGQLLGITNWFLELEWDLSAKGIYPINHKMLPLLLTLGLTYIIFIFQLRSS